MKKPFFLMLALFALTITSLSQPAVYQSDKLQKIWEANGFSTPESVLPVPEKGILYVSNIGVQGSAESEKTGFISVLNHDGSIQELKWVTGLKAPKGMAISGDRLYVTQVNSIAEIDIASGHLLRTFDVEGAQFLNDIVADASGALYISDSKTGTVHRLKDGAITTFIKSSDFTFPNGLAMEGNNLFLGTGDRVVRIDLTTGETEDYMLNTEAVDGLTILSADCILFSNWKGTVYTMRKGSEKELLLDTSSTESVKSADFGYNTGEKLIYIPTFFGNSVVCYKLSVEK